MHHSKAVGKADSTGKVYSLGIAPAKSANLESAVTSTNVKIADSVKYPEFTSIGFLPTGSDDPTLKVRLTGVIYAGDLNHYKLQISGNLSSTNNWIDSTVPESDDIYEEFPTPGVDYNFYVNEPFNSSNKFYRLVQNEVAN